MADNTGGPHAGQASALDVEAAVLGALLLEPERLVEVGFLDPRSWAVRKHELLHRVLLEMHALGRPVEVHLVAAELDRRGHLAEVGGTPYLLDLMESVVGAHSTVEHARLVQQAAQRRELAQLGRELAADARGGVDVAELVERTKPRLELLAAGARGSRLRRGRLRALDAVLDLPPLDWVVRDLLPHPSLALLAAAPNVGKSTLALGWCLSALYGRPWCGVEVGAGSSLLVAGEGVRGIGARVRAWEAEHRGGHTTDGRFLAVLDDVPSLASQEGQTALTDAIDDLREQHGHAPRFVVVDTLQSLTPGLPENDAEALGPVLAALRRVVEQVGCTVVLVHHITKAHAEQRTLTLDRVRGSSALAGAVDTVLALEPAGESLRLLSLKQRDAARAEPMMLRLHANPHGAFLRIAAPVLPEAEPSLEDLARADVDRVCDALERLGSATSASEVVRRLKGRRCDLLAAFKEAQGRGRITNEGSAREPRFVVASVCVAPPHTPPGTGNRVPRAGSPEPGPVPVERGSGTDGNRREPAGNRREPTGTARKARKASKAPRLKA